MIKPETLQTINIIAISLFTFVQCVMIGGMKYSLKYCIQRWLSYSDYDKMVWLMRNKYYIWSHIIILILIPLCLGLMSQLNYGLPLIREMWTLILSILGWTSMSIWAYYMYKKIKENEKYEPLD